jgi:hypothetical protein
MSSEAGTSPSRFAQIHVWLENPIGDISTMMADGDIRPLEDGSGYDAGDILRPNGVPLPTCVWDADFKGILLEIYPRG